MVHSRISGNNSKQEVELSLFLDNLVLSWHDTDYIPLYIESTPNTFYLFRIIYLNFLLEKLEKPLTKTTRTQNQHKVIDYYVLFSGLLFVY